MGRFPLDDLLAATEVSHISTAVAAIFEHMKHVYSRALAYAARWPGLIAALSRDVTTKLVEVLPTNLMLLPHEDFLAATRECKGVFQEWKMSITDLRAQLKKHSVQVRMGQVAKDAVQLVVLERRIEALRAFRNEHHHLRKVIETVFKSYSQPEQGGHSHSRSRSITGAEVQAVESGSGAGAGAGAGAGTGAVTALGATTTPARFAGAAAQVLRELDRSYAPFLNMPVLDVSARGEEDWRAALEAYRLRIAHADSLITRKLLDQLGACRCVCLSWLVCIPVVCVCVCVCLKVHYALLTCCFRVPAPPTKCSACSGSSRSCWSAPPSRARSSSSSLTSWAPLGTTSKPCRPSSQNRASPCTGCSGGWTCAAPCLWPVAGESEPHLTLRCAW